MAIHFYPKVGGRVDFDTPEEAARFFELTGGGTREAPPTTEAKVTQVAMDPGTPAHSTPAPSTATPKTRSRKSTSSKQRFEDSIQIVMGANEMTAPEIHEKLAERGWLPVSKDPLNYVRYALSSNKSIFQSTKRGHYRLDPSNPYTTGNHEAPIPGHVNPKAAKGKDTTPKPPTAKSKPKVVEPTVTAAPEVVEPPEVEASDAAEAAQRLADAPVMSEPDAEDLIEQLASESEDQVEEEPQVEAATPEPQVEDEPEVQVAPPPEPEPQVIVPAPAPPKVEVAPPTPVSKPVVEPPPVAEGSDPVLDILKEFADELGSI